VTGLPKETEKDVIESMEFIDRVKHHNVFVWVFPLICRSGRCARTRPNGHPSTCRCARSCDTERHENLCRHDDRKAVVGHHEGHAKGNALCGRADNEVRPVVGEALLHTEQAIERGEDRLNLYKGLQSGYNDDAGEAVMLASNVVRDLVQIKRQNDLASTGSWREIFSYMPGTILFPFPSQLDLLLAVKFQNYYYYFLSSSRERSRG
jgi:hypothetical protein